ICDEHYTDPRYTTKYRTLFKNQGPASGDIAYIDCLDALKAIRLDKGLAVIAHPGQLNSYELIEEYHEYIDGVEKYHPDHNQEDYDKVDALVINMISLSQVAQTITVILEQQSRLV